LAAAVVYDRGGALRYSPAMGGRSCLRLMRCGRKVSIATARDAISWNRN